MEGKLGMNTSTCIVGVVHSGKVFIGGDSAGVSRLDTVTRADTKVFLKEDGPEKMIMGYTSSFRMGQLLRFSLSIPERSKNMDVYEYMVTKFIDAIRECFKDGGFAQKKDEAESGGTFLVGYEGRLFAIYNDYQVGENAYSYNACGCGEDYAMSSLYSTEKLIKDPEKRIRIAMSAAEEFSGGVKSPFIIKEL